MPFLSAFAADYATVNTGGTVDWTVPAIFPRPGGATCTLPGGAKSYQLQLSNFGFAVPTGATVTGILVQVDRRQSAGSGVIKDDEVTLGALTSNKADLATAWPGSLTSALYGNSGDLWGATWTVAAINSASFTAILSVQETSLMSAATALVDAIQVTVYYTAPPSMIDEDEGIQWQTRTLW